MTSCSEYLNDANFHVLLSLFDEWIEGKMEGGEFAGSNIFGYYDLVAERGGLQMTVAISMLEPSVSIVIKKGENEIFWLSRFDCNYINIVDIKNKVIEFGLADWGKPLMRCVLSLTGDPIVKIDTQYQFSTNKNYIRVGKA